MRFGTPRLFAFTLLFVMCVVAAGITSGARSSELAGDMSLRGPFGSTQHDASKMTDAMGLPPGTQLLSHDDGSFEQALGVTDPEGEYGSQAVFLNRFTPDPNQLPITIDTVSFLFPLETSVGATGLESGMLFEVLVYTDPASNVNPTAATLVRRQAFHIQPSNSVFQNVTLDDPITIDKGTVYIGFTNTVTASTDEPIYPGALDVNSPLQVSLAFFNTELFSHFDGTDLTVATSGPVVLGGTWLIRALYSTGGSMRVCWDAGVGAGAPPPANARVCTPAAGGSGVVPASTQGPRDTLLGYNVYRGTSPGVTPTPGNFFTSTGPGQTSAGSSVAPGGSFFVITGVYDTGESDPSNEINASAGTVTSVKVKPTKVVTKGAGFTSTVQVFVDGIPFVAPATVKQLKKVTQKGNLLTGQSVQAYLASNGGTARMTIRNTSGATVTRTIP